ncbi:substrate-binding periplasmic protein [Kordiimonas lacus]|uniref:Amino acid ABC transporter substrate-binding protein, PAAT family n=1 Tax=Kordiimonas lacus TaxID=637679 RepID=A0A1G7CQC4_9PROT|nr:transporter substrate-binding domain-containing protein [Kordiimonas lacus]SDE41552.1 amino acid ABC transporter substrate-binding protein, PAAT family [Kordiimonas lacus]
MRASLTNHALRALFTAICLSPPVTAQTAATPPEMIEIATRENLPPYVVDRAAHGIEIDLVQAILKGSGYEPVFVQQPRVRMISAFENGQMNGILTQNVLASEVGCATDWYIAHQNIAVSMTSKNLSIDSLDDLKGLSILSFSGATRYLGSEFQQAVRHSKRYTESGDQSKHIKLLYNGRFDAVVGDRWILALAQKSHFTKTGEYRELKHHPIMEPSLYVARFHDQKVCDAFNLGLRRLRADGSYAEIWNGYRKSLAVTTDSKAPVPQ